MVEVEVLQRPSIGDLVALTRPVQVDTLSGRVFDGYITEVEADLVRIEGSYVPGGAVAVRCDDIAQVRIYY